MSVTSRTDDHRTDEHSIQCAMTSRDAFIRFFNRATRPIGTDCKLKLHRSAIALVLLLVLVSEAQAQAPSAMEQGLRDMLTGSGAAAQSSLTSPALTPSQALLDANGSQAGPSQASAAQSGPRKQVHLKVVPRRIFCWLVLRNGPVAKACRAVCKSFCC